MLEKVEECDLGFSRPLVNIVLLRMPVILEDYVRGENCECNLIVTSFTQENGRIMLVCIVIWDEYCLC